jgi:hypothetical protein
MAWPAETLSVSDAGTNAIPVTEQERTSLAKAFGRPPLTFDQPRGFPLQDSHFGTFRLHVAPVHMGTAD